MSAASVWSMADGGSSLRPSTSSRPSWCSSVTLGTTTPAKGSSAVRPMADGALGTLCPPVKVSLGGWAHFHGTSYLKYLINGVNWGGEEWSPGVAVYLFLDTYIESGVGKIPIPWTKYFLASCNLIKNCLLVILILSLSWNDLPSVYWKYIPFLINFIITFVAKKKKRKKEKKRNH
jgi:hypothetical protein